MKPPPFMYHRPSTLDEALELLGEYGDEAKVLAGGQSLMPLLSLRLAHPAHLVDINRVDGQLGQVAQHDSGLSVGALVRQRAAETSRSGPRRLSAARGSAAADRPHADSQSRDGVWKPGARRPGLGVASSYVGLGCRDGGSEPRTRNAPYRRRRVLPRLFDDRAGARRVAHRGPLPAWPASTAGRSRRSPDGTAISPWSASPPRCAWTRPERVRMYGWRRSAPVPPASRARRGSRAARAAVLDGKRHRRCAGARESGRSGVRRPGDGCLPSSPHGGARSPRARRGSDTGACWRQFSKGVLKMVATETATQPQTMRVELTVNGQPRSADVEVRMTLADFLRGTSD